MTDGQAFVKNAADPEQVKAAKRKERFNREDELNDIRFLLTLPQFRKFIWRMITYCNVFASIWRPSAEIHHLSGKQDVGHFILAEVVEANEDAFLQMMKESKKEKSNG